MSEGVQQNHPRIVTGQVNKAGAAPAAFGAVFCRPFGTRVPLNAVPSVETLGYYRMSLRDKGPLPLRVNHREALGLPTTTAL